MAIINVEFLGKKYTVTYDDALQGTIADMLAQQYGYQVNIPNPNFKGGEPITAENSPVVANPSDKAKYIVEKMVGGIVEQAKQREIQKAREVAEKAAREAANAQFSGVDVKEVV